MSSLTVYDYNTVPSSSPADGHLKCVQYGTTANKTLVNIPVQIFLWLYAFIWVDEYVGVKLLGDRVGVCFVL